MDSIRAKEIISSGELIQVLYQGSPVWLENVKDNKIAEITKLDSKDKMEVPLSLLVEDKELV